MALSGTFNPRDEIFDAVMEGGLADVAALLDAGTDPNATWNGTTPLIAAAARGHAEIAALLLDHGAEINARNRAGFSALLTATNENKPEAVRLLVERGAAVEMGNRNFRNTPLMFAAAKGFTEVARILVEGLADLDKKNGEGQTALAIAEKYNHGDVARLLREAPALQEQIICVRAEARRLSEMHDKTADKQALLQKRAAAALRLRPRGL